MDVLPRLSNVNNINNLFGIPPYLLYADGYGPSLNAITNLNMAERQCRQNQRPDMPTEQYLLFPGN